MGQPSALGDADAGNRTPHAVIGVLVRARPSAARAMGWTAMGDPVLHLLVETPVCCLGLARTRR